VENLFKRCSVRSVGCVDLSNELLIVVVTAVDWFFVHTKFISCPTIRTLLIPTVVLVLFYHLSTSFQHEPNLVDFLVEDAVAAQVVFYFIAGVDKSGMVAAAHLVANGRERNMKVLA